MKTTKILTFAALAALITTGTFATALSGTQKEGKGYVPGEVLIKFKSDAKERSRGRIRGKVNGLISRRYKNIGIEKINISSGQSVEQAVELLEKDPLVEFAEPNWVVEFLGMPSDPPDDPGFLSGDQWYLSTAPFQDTFLPPDTTLPVDVDIDAPEAWGVMASVFNSGMTAVVVVLDSGCGESGYFSDSTGYIPDHVDLPNSMLFANTAELAVIGSDSPADANDLVDDVNGWNWVEDNNIPADKPDFLDPVPFHGSRVTGIIAAQWGNGTDIAGIGKGHLKILPLRTEDVGDIVAGIDYAIEMAEAGKPVRVLNASFNSPESQSLELAVEQAGGAGIAVAAAAGNRGHTNDNSLASVYPAEYTKIPLTNVLAVAATGTDGALADFSNYGLSSVQIAAPGATIYSTGGGAGGYAAASGTSFSTPVAAAALGLILAAHPDMSPEQAIIRLVNGGDFDYRLSGKLSSGKRVNLAGGLAPFYPYSGLAPLDGSTIPVFMYTDAISSSYGSITLASSSDDTVAVMVTEPSNAWMISPVSPGIVSFTLSFEDVGAPLGSYETGPWRVTAISPFSAAVMAGETVENPFVSLLPGTVSWSVMDSAIVTIDEDGWFTGRLPGSTRVVLSINGTPVDSSGIVTVQGSLLPDKSSSDCFIATAAYGSALEPHVASLREFRDRFLLKSSLGRSFVSCYYRHSPRLAEFIAANRILKLITRVVLLPVAAYCNIANRFGLLPAALMPLVFTALPAGIIRLRLRRRTA